MLRQEDTQILVVHLHPFLFVFAALLPSSSAALIPHTPFPASQTTSISPIISRPYFPLLLSNPLFSFCFCFYSNRDLWDLLQCEVCLSTFSFVSSLCTCTMYKRSWTLYECRCSVLHPPLPRQLDPLLVLYPLMRCVSVCLVCIFGWLCAYM